jgi:hypothetical protein
VAPIDYKDQPIVTARGKSLSSSDVRAALTRAAVVHNWALSDVSPGAFDATLVVRKHRVVVRITFNAERFSIVYRSSENMNFGVANGESYIHPKYNQWVANLVSDIRKELARL